MWEIQPDWTLLDRFYVRTGDSSYSLSRSGGALVCSDASVSLQVHQRRSFTITSREGTCTFLAPTRTLDIHSGESINCVAVSADGAEVMSGDRAGRLLLTHIGTDPIPLPGPTPDFDVEDCCFDGSGQRWFACGGDFRIYEYSATEYQQTGAFAGHRSAVTCVRARGQRLFSGARDGCVCVWDIAARRKLATADLHSAVNDICFAGGGLVYAATEGAVRALDERTLQSAPSPPAARGRAFNSVAASGDTVVAGADDGALIACDARRPERALCEWRWYDSPVNRVRFGGGGDLWVACNDGTAARVALADKRFTAVLGTPAYAPVRDIAPRGFAVWTAGGEGALSHFEF